MGYEKFYEECSEKLTCKYCGTTITGGCSPYGGGITSKDALKRHEAQCSKNPESEEGRLLSDIKRCQTRARICDCLNCQHYHKRCKGTNN